MTGIVWLDAIRDVKDNQTNSIYGQKPINNPWVAPGHGTANHADAYGYEESVSKWRQMRNSVMSNAVLRTIITMLPAFNDNDFQSSLAYKKMWENTIQALNVTTDVGFGTVICYNINGKSANFVDYYCNDSWDTQSSTVNIPKAPDNWDKAHCVRYTELGNIPNAFYGGWSCDYNGTGVGASWAGVGKGHK